MKTNVVFALFTLFILTLTSLAQDTWTPQGSSVIYGTPGKGLWNIGVNADDPTQSEAEQSATLNDLYSKGVHPFLWVKHIQDEIVWHISGTEDALNKELKSVPVDEGVQPSWIWDSAPNKPIIIFVELPKNGFGRINVFQGQQIIASFKCVSSALVNEGTEFVRFSQPAPKEYKILFKKEVKESKEIKGAVMKKAMCIDDVRGIYLHSRNIGENSHGCIGISAPSAGWLFQKALVGTSVSISSGELIK